MTERICDRSHNPCQCQGAKSNGLSAEFCKTLTALCLKALLGLVLSNGLWTEFVPDQRKPQPRDFCHKERYLSENYTDFTKAANELFWQAHPELNRRPILADENAFASEWWTYYDVIDSCHKNRIL